MEREREQLSQCATAVSALLILRRIGIYGGTFDPVHHAHLILAREALEQLQLEQVVFVPAAVSPHKLQGTAAPADARLAMLHAAVAGEPRFCVDDLEMQRPSPSFAIDTALEMQRRYANSELFYLLGNDNVPALRTWHRFEELRAIVQFVVLDRVGTAADHSFSTVRRHLNISATEIRERIRNGAPISYFVPAAVERIIRERALYQEVSR